MAVVPIYIPGTQHAIHIALMARAAHMIGNLIITPLLQCLANAGGNVIQRLIPAYALPLTRAALALALHGVENTLRVLDLVDGGRSFGTVAAATARVVGVTFKLAYLTGFFIYIAQQTTG